MKTLNWETWSSLLAFHCMNFHLQVELITGSILHQWPLRCQSCRQTEITQNIAFFFKSYFFTAIKYKEILFLIQKIYTFSYIFFFLINKFRTRSFLANSRACSRSSIRGIKTKIHPECANSHKLVFTDVTCRNNVLHCDISSSIQLSKIWLRSTNKGT